MYGGTMEKERILREATFSPKVQVYWMLSGTITCVIMCIGLIGFVLLPLWLVFGTIITGKVRKSMSCVLTDRSLKFSKGVLTRVEKTVPLEKITDLGLVQGPIMRHFGLHTLTIETAGQSGPGSLLRLTGIEDTLAFREAVLEQRDRTVFDSPGKSRDGDRVAGTGSASPSQAAAAVASPAQDPQVLADIRDTLGRIESLLRDKPS